jgi:hypothetical protein
MKALEIAGLQSHLLARPNVSGRAPAISTFSFSPLALYGACARASHLHLIDPSVASPESRITSALIREHVDNAGADFAVLKTVKRFKDHWRAHFIGTVAEGLGYLEMINDGYVWADHFENLLGGNPKATASPDYVFTGPNGIGTALVESKGSRSPVATRFKGMVRRGYKRQIEPHLGHSIGGAPATHGFSIGSHLYSSTKAEMHIHHTAVPSTLGSSGSSAAPAPLVQRGNYATAFNLAHSVALGSAIRTGDETGDIPFVRMPWRGRHWLTSYIFGGVSHGGMMSDIGGLLQSADWSFPGVAAPAYGFAIEENVAKVVLGRCLGQPELRESLSLDTLQFQDEPAGSELDREAASPSGVVFPDGLAIIGRGHLQGQTVVWDTSERRLRTRGNP